MNSFSSPETGSRLIDFRLARMAAAQGLFADPVFVRFRSTMGIAARRVLRQKTDACDRFCSLATHVSIKAERRKPSGVGLRVELHWQSTAPRKAMPGTTGLSLNVVLCQPFRLSLRNANRKRWLLPFSPFFAVYPYAFGESLRPNRLNH